MRGRSYRTPFFFHIRNSFCATDVASRGRTTAQYLTDCGNRLERRMERTKGKMDQEADENLQ